MLLLFFYLYFLIHALLQVGWVKDSKPNYLWEGMCEEVKNKGMNQDFILTIKW